MFKISRRQTILRASLIGCFVVAVLSTASYFIINQLKNTNAITHTNDRVDVVYDTSIGEIHFGSNNTGTEGGQGAYTRWYQVNVEGVSTLYNAFCAQPSKGYPVADDKKADELSNNEKNGALIKLMIYIWQYNNSATQALRSEIFGPVEDNDVWGGSARTRRYAFTHSVIGGLYDADYFGLNSAEKNLVQNVANILQNAKDSNSEAWQNAKNYKLFRALDNNQTSYDQQEVVWIEATGSITVQKCDAEITSSCIAQGNANFNGITFTLLDGNTQVDTKTLTNGAHSVTFSGLDPDKTYTIKEGGTNAFYNVTSSSQTASPTVAGVTKTFRNTIKKGKITINKIDKDTGTCTNYGKLSFAGTTFRLTNTSANSIYYNGSAIAKNGVVATKVMSANECSFSFDNLPYGSYSVQETVAAPGYVLDSTPRPITIPTNNNATITYTFENQPIRGDITFTKKDSTTNTPMANAVFEISSISDGYMENHIVVADANGVVDTRASVNPHTNHTNGYDEIYYSSETPIAYAGYGTWFGLKGKATTPRNDVGALPAGSYLIQELKCDTNMFCTNLNNEKKPFTISTNGQVVNLNDDGKNYWGNNCANFSITTNAVDKNDGDKYIEAEEDAAIKDVIDYCAKSGYTYTITGTLMDKSTGEPLLVDGKTITQSLTIPSDANDCGTVEMLFPVNASDLAGKSIVVFEKLYYKNEIKASHEDINDLEQTVDVISLGTIATDNDDDKIVVPSEETIIKDTATYCAVAGQPYTITGTLIDKTTGEPILLNDKPVTQSVTFTSEEACGTVEIVFPAIDTTAIAGHPVVVYETLYKVTSTSDPDSGEPVISHEDLNDEDQTVYIIDISTTIQPTEDGTKIFPVNADVTVTDMVHYCLQPGLEYTIKGVVMDKNTGNGLLVNSNLVEQSVTFTPTEVCGEFPMYYTFNTQGLSGAQLVVFESLYYNDELLIEHKDINNELESFEIDITPPETGFITKNASGSQETSHHELLIIAAIAISPIAVYVFGRRQARKRFLNR